MSTKILFVDDDANILAAYQRTLRKQFTLDIAENGEAALAMMATGEPYAVVVADMQMPGMNGVQFLMKARDAAPDTVRVMLTGNADQKTATDAVNQGHVFRFLTKPCESEALARTLTAALNQYRLVTAERELLEKTLQGSIKVLTDILSMLDPQAFGRSQRMRDQVRTFARSHGSSQTWELEVAAMVAQIGYVTVPPALLQKVRAGHGLAGPEKDLLARVPQIGADLLANIPRLENVARIVLYQNKNFDGSGFPSDGVAGEDIPLGSRILRVLNDLAVCEAGGMPLFKAFKQMQHAAGRYDPKVLQAIAASFDQCISTEIAEGGTRSIGWKELRVGHRLKSEVCTAEGTLIVPCETEISGAVLEKLRNFAQISGIREPILIAD